MFRYLFSICYGVFKSQKVKLPQNGEEVIHLLLSSRNTDQRTALNLISNIETQAETETIAVSSDAKTQSISKLNREDLLMILNNCDAIPKYCLTEIIKFHLLSSNSKIHEACLRLLEEQLPRPGRKLIIEFLMEQQAPEQLLAIKLSKQWSSMVYGELIAACLESSNQEVVIKAIEALAHISLGTWMKKFVPLMTSDQEEIRLGLAQTLTQHKEQNIRKDLIQIMLNDELSSIRMMSLRCMRVQLNTEWISLLEQQLQTEEHQEVIIEIIRLLGETKHPKALSPIYGLLQRSMDQGVHWASLQSLESIPTKKRLSFYSQKIPKADTQELALIYELIGSCKGKETYDILLDNLHQTKEPELKSLIASAMGTCGHPEAEKELLQLMDEDVTVAYSAASALKNLTKGKAMGHFETYLKKDHVDNLVKQILLQHITETALTLQAKPSLIETIHDLFKHENENIRYLSILASGAIASPSSLRHLIPLLEETWTELFKDEIFQAIEKCCQQSITPILELLAKSDGQQKEDLVTFIGKHSLVLKDGDLDELDQNPSFKNWKWDEALLHCIAKTHQKDPSFIWRQFSQPNLSERRCCFLARGFHEAGPQFNDMVDPIVLIRCFNRFQTEKPLLLLGKLMANFPRAEFLPPLIQYCEGADPDTEMIFKSYVHKIVMSMTFENQSHAS
jgi:HEAT repeat protein